jgi:hypothetical protein
MTKSVKVLSSRLHFLFAACKIPQFAQTLFAFLKYF